MKEFSPIKIYFTYCLVFLKKYRLSSSNVLENKNTAAISHTLKLFGFEF